MILFPYHAISLQCCFWTNESGGASSIMPLPFPQPLTFAKSSAFDDPAFFSSSPSPVIKILPIMFFIPFLFLSLGRVMVLTESLLLSLRSVLLCSHPIWSNFSISINFYLSFLLEASLHLTCPKAFESVHNRKILKHLFLTICNLIDSMTSVEG